MGPKHYPLPYINNARGGALIPSLLHLNVHLSMLLPQIFQQLGIIISHFSVPISDASFHFVHMHCTTFPPLMPSSAQYPA